ncbi:unnamed protein product [Pleuronectes platessa]|uniref:Uncharacterized protein n=1 Tax=Pleuronectes platessa TaxID=8262 RepID=A0A9N7VPN3_PLEPL|nr:unnamed protein product [Pleuronectes platessa]
MHVPSQRSGEEVWSDGLKHSITQFYLGASSLSPNSTLKTTILPLIPVLNSSFGIREVTPASPPAQGVSWVSHVSIVSVKRPGFVSPASLEPALVQRRTRPHTSARPLSSSRDLFMRGTGGWWERLKGSGALVPGKARRRRLVTIRGESQEDRDPPAGLNPLSAPEYNPHQNPDPRPKPGTALPKSTGSWRTWTFIPSECICCLLGLICRAEGNPRTLAILSQIFTQKHFLCESLLNKWNTARHGTARSAETWSVYVGLPGPPLKLQLKVKLQSSESKRSSCRHTEPRSLGVWGLVPV